MKKIMRRLLAAAFVLMLLSAQCFALTIGTFNIEYFSISGKNAYVADDLKALATTIKKSGADVLALQEIEGNATMRYFTTKALNGWGYYGNDTNGKQDLYFLWNPQKVSLEGTPSVYYAKEKGTFEGKSFKLFDRPPLVARFRDKSTGEAFTLVNVHLKSMSTRGKDDAKEAQRYNEAKRSAQFKKLNELSKSIKGPAFILGDYNDTDPQSEAAYPLIGLKNGTSYDNHRSNLDYIGYINIDRDRLSDARETETRISRRSTKRSQHPDHDIITVEVFD